MKHKILLIALLSLVVAQLFTFVIAHNVLAEERLPKIKVSVDKNNGNIGDIIHYRIRLNIPAGLEVKNYPAKTEMLGDFIVKDFTQLSAKDKSNDLIFDYALTLFKTGKHSIPECTLEYRDNQDQDWQVQNSKAIEVTIDSMLEQDKNPALKALKPRIIIWRDYLKWMIVVFLLIALMLGLLKLWRRKHPALEKAVKIEPAHVLALKELDELQKLNLPARGFMEEYFARLSGVLRRYLENRFGLRAPWMSTEEFLVTAKTSTLLGTKQRALLKDFLLLSDLVKFARYGSSPKEAEDSFFTARNFIEETKEMPPEQENNKK